MRVQSIGELRKRHERTSPYDPRCSESYDAKYYDIGGFTKDTQCTHPYTSEKNKVCKD
jgi:hypothetical protein